MTELFLTKKRRRTTKKHCVVRLRLGYNFGTDTHERFTKLRGTIRFKADFSAQEKAGLVAFLKAL